MYASRLLIVDDTSANIDILRATLNGLDCQISVATDGERALKIIERSPPELILLDVMMPGIDGFEVCRRLKGDARYKDIPVIFVTARTDDISTGFDSGGDDYITKPFNASEVISRVQHHLDKQKLIRKLKDLNSTLEEKVRDRTAALAITNRQLREEIKERRYMQDRMQYLASHDFITQLYNRTALDEHVTSCIAEVQLDHINCQFLMVDIDQFRLINESCGCIAGDELLRQFAEIVAGQCTSDMFVSRIGGDNFAIVCRGASADEGMAIAHRISKSTTEFQFEWEKRSFELNTTIAVVTINDNITSFDQLMLMTDEVCYLAKKDGRNKVLHYSDKLDSAPNARHKTINWGLKLVDALKHDQFSVWFQHIHRLAPQPGEDQHKIEVLARLIDSTDGSIIGPDQFIPAAERLNLIPHVDNWMVHNTLRFMRENPNLLENISSVGINLSAVSIRDKRFAENIIHAIESHNIPAEKICFEITETEAIVNIEGAQQFLTTLSRFGCKLALDDFGSGFSSFNYLRELPFDIVKIDGVFVKDMDKNASYQALVKSITEVAHELNKEVIAEFVENESIAQSLIKLGVTWAQGYHYHRPIELTYNNLKEVTGRAKKLNVKT
ncbi:GGDEF/EAL domain-containing response regulator [Teredinibacter haidensis]|uniref:GGDEF/EAL domain-containing response regulator n=1 Tax=Teredinibacter haidensis TaxID=2731755 RepID=UPI000949110C|nr:EAL domain-containing protein [Teredinibacter haidensis]